MKTINTTELTANKKFKSIVRENIKWIIKLSKVYVPVVGYVTFLKDVEGNILGKFFRENTWMTLYIN